MSSAARIGTLLGALSLAACSQSHENDVDASHVDAAREEDAGEIIEGTCTAEQRASASLDGPYLGLEGLFGTGPWAGTISNVGEAGIDLVLDDGTSARFVWTGTSLDGLSAGMSATVRREDRWTVLEAGGVRLHALSAFGFTGFDVVGVPMTISGAPGLTLVEECTFREGGGGCGGPPALATLYALDVGGTAILSADEQTSGVGYEVFFGGSVQYPGYGSDTCVVEAAFQASIAVRVVVGEADSCESIETEYAQLVAESSSCATDSDCMVLGGQCGVGLGGCYEATSSDVSGQLEELGRRYADLDCTSGVCDCAEPPVVHCAAGRCTFAP